MSHRLHQLGRRIYGTRGHKGVLHDAKTKQAEPGNHSMDKEIVVTLVLADDGVRDLVRVCNT